MQMRYFQKCTRTCFRRKTFITTFRSLFVLIHYNDVIMSAMASQITGISIVCSTVCSDADQRKHQSSTWLDFVRGIHRSPVDSPHKGPVTRIMFQFDCRMYGRHGRGPSTDAWIWDLESDGKKSHHYSDITMASQITSLAIVYSTVYSGADQRKHQSSASLAFMWGIHRWPVNSPHKWPVTRKMLPFDDVSMH